MVKVNLSNFNTHINFKKDKQNQNKEHKTESPQVQTSGYALQPKFNDHLLSFKGRVDKGLDRFYEANKDRMPSTFRRYLESMEDKTRITPLEAQKRAFAKLESANTIQDIQQFFPDEELFKDLKTIKDSKATRGIIQVAKENKELFEMFEKGILKDNTDPTVYLVKKIFLEAKTIDEINKDLENDLDEDFKAFFKEKVKDQKENTGYIYGSTLKSLGIQMPKFEYQQSLRYTRDGYSDAVGDNIAKGRQAFFDSLSEEERTARAKKSVQKFENWWNSLTLQAKLDMIADEQTPEDMLKQFKKIERAEKKQNTQNQTDVQNDTIKERKHTKVGSEKLSKDELFIKWATMNLKNFQNNLSEAQKDTLHVKRMQRLVQRWAQMSGTERTEYISKMKAGSEPLRFAMIDAWNNNIDLIKDLSAHLRANQIYKPADLLYSTEEFSMFQSQVMTEFWDKHADYAVELGQSIIKSQEKINKAIASGTFEELKKQIMRDKNQRVKTIEKFKNSQPLLQPQQPQQPQQSTETDYKTEFKNAYNAHTYGKIKSIPKNYYNDMYDMILEQMPEDAVRIWTKNLKYQELTPEEKAYVESFLNKETPQSAKINRALEAALADTIYRYTKDASVYTLSSSDVKTVLYHIENGDSPIKIQSHKTGKAYTYYVNSNKKVDAARINNLYEEYKKDITSYEAADIIESYFDAPKEYVELSQNSAVPVSINGFDAKGMIDYLSTYGTSLGILFSTHSAYPTEVKKAFYQKLKANAPENLKSSFEKCILEKPAAFEAEERLKKAGFQLAQRFDFVPKEYVNSYFKNLANILRQGDLKQLEEISETFLTKRKNISSNKKLLVMKKSDISSVSKLDMLIIEQALADVLYQATQNVDVYGLEFEELCDNIEIFNLVKKYPSEARTYKSQSLGREISLTAQRKINTSLIKNLAQQYYEELVQSTDEVNKENRNLDKEDMLFVLNPDENKPEVDKMVLERINSYKLFD